IHKSDMVIEKTPGTVASTGPDHIVRLFAYNHIMQQLGAGLLLDRPIDDSLVTIARKAYVVTPISSLIVLETQQDYDQHTIQDLDQSLKNASMHSKGAVPEPHEWALIIIGASLLIWLRYKNRFQHSKATV
ncbi:MAG TPA: hypothetical protein VHM26_16915, partial [Chitinophagaceae bacterium]|nr:hypothetical protein [Chitinophagaceae bacterium]